MLLLRFIILSCGCLLSAVTAEPSARLSVLFLGDNGHHKPVERYKWIKEPLSSRGIDVTYTDQLSDLQDKTLAAYDVLLVYANIPGVSADQEQAILNFVAQGKGFVPVHCASACFGNNPALVKLMGGKFKSHGTAVFRAAIVNRNHATMKGFGGFDTWDETYVHNEHNDENRVVLMERDNEPWTWIRTYGKGRVFYTASGHDERTWKAPGFCDLLARGLSWSAGKNGESTLNELLGNFSKDNRVALEYEARTTVQNYEKRSPYPLYQLPLSAKDSQDYIITEHGFDVSLFASEPDIIKPIAFTWDHRGRLWVAESVDYPSKYTDLWGGNDRIKICEDTNGDGKADKFTIFADKLNIPTGLVFANGGLIIAQAPQMLFLKDTNGDDVADERQVLMEGWSKGDTHAGPSNLRYGFDNKIYGAVGYSGFKGTGPNEGVSFRSGLYRFDKRGNKVEFLSQFSNNTWGLGISETGELFGSTANNTHHCYCPIPAIHFKNVYGIENVEQLIKATKMDAHYHADVLTEQIRQVDVFKGFTAAAGHNLYTARSFPKAYWNRAALVCEPTTHVLHQGFLRRDGSGWTEDGDGGNLFASEDQWVAPVHAEVGPDGAVWIADWYNFIIQHNPTPRKEHGGFDANTGKGGAHENPLRDEKHGRIYKVTWKGAAAGRQSLDANNINDLINALSDDNLFWRLTAQRLLVERNKTDVVPALMTLLDDQRVDEVGINGGVIHALWTLHGLGAFLDPASSATQKALKCLRHPALGVRRNAIQVLVQTPTIAEHIAASGILHDQDLNVRLAAYLSVSELEPSDAIGRLLFKQFQEPAVQKDVNTAQALQLAIARHGRGYLKAARTAQITIPVDDVAQHTVRPQLLPNNDFELTQQNNPTDWKTVTYAGVATFSQIQGGRSGKCLKIEATGNGADASWTTVVTVKPQTTYRLSGWVKTNDVKGAMGALFNIHGKNAKSQAVKGSNQKWKQLTLTYTTANETELIINCLFGGWGSSTGSAYFDDVNLAEESADNKLGAMERIIGMNIVAYSTVQEQVDLLSWLATGDQGIMAAVVSGMAEHTLNSELPAGITKEHRDHVSKLIPHVHAKVQQHLGSLIARWSGATDKKVVVAAGPQLSPEELKRFSSGRDRYMALCIACHQPNGQGLPGLAPSLVKSEWVQGPISRPARIVLHGLQGPITVNGENFTAPVIMPPQKDVLDDVAIAEVLTYVRNEWGNTGTPVQAEDIKKIRETESQRTAPWTGAELLKIE